MTPKCQTETLQNFLSQKVCVVERKKTSILQVDNNHLLGRNNKPKGVPFPLVECWKITSEEYLDRRYFSNYCEI